MIDQTFMMTLSFHIECGKVGHSNEYWTVKFREDLHNISAKCVQTYLQRNGETSGNDEAILGIIAQATTSFAFISRYHERHLQK
jgi:hypothetical protein